MFWKQNRRVLWLWERDINSKFFDDLMKKTDKRFESRAYWMPREIWLRMRRDW